MNLTALSVAFEELRQNSLAMRTLRATCPDDWRKSYVNLRRKAQLAVQGIAVAGEACFQSGLCRHLEKDFRNALNTMRSTIAYHQANWPVVALDPDNADYRKSFGEVDAAVQAFQNVVAQMLSSGRAAA